MAKLNRRNMLGQAAGLAGVGALAGMSTQPANAARKTRSRVPFDPLNPMHNAMGYAKMVGNLDGTLTYNYSTGYIVGFLPGELPRQLTGFEQIKVNRIEPQGDGVFLETYSSVYMFTEIDKPVLLDSWTNPYTGRTNEPFHYRSGPSKTLITPGGFKSARNPDGPGSPDPFLLPWLFMGDKAFMRMNSASWFPSALDPAEWALESPGKLMISAFLNTEMGLLAELEDPDVPSVATTGFVNAQSNWLPWMLMGKIPGSIAYHVVSQKTNKLSDLPEASLANAEKVQPGFLEKAFELPYSLQYDEYKKHRRPAG